MNLAGWKFCVWKRHRCRSPGWVRWLCECTRSALTRWRLTFAREHTGDCQSCLTHRGTTARAWWSRSARMSVSLKPGIMFIPRDRSAERMRSSRCAKKSKCIRCLQIFPSRKAQPWGRRTRRRTAGCCSAPKRSQVKRCWCTARAAV